MACWVHIDEAGTVTAKQTAEPPRPPVLGDGGLLVINHGPRADGWHEAPDWVCVGCTHDGAAFHAPVPVVAVPDAVTMRQARLALLGAGLLTQVQTAIDALSEPQKTAAKISWEYSAHVQRHNGLVPQMAAALGLSEAQIDALFISAAAL